MKVFGLPDDLREAVSLLMCERTYLVQLLKGLIDRLLSGGATNIVSKPKIFNDPFLEQAFTKKFS